MDGTPLPKPFYFIQEDGGYKLNIMQPDIGVSSSSSYRVRNGDSEPREFRCEGIDLTNVAPQQEVRAYCVDTCPGGSGTRFYAPDGASADCDYNSWGLDMTITNGYPKCNDFC